MYLSIKLGAGVAPAHRDTALPLRRRLTEPLKLLLLLLLRRLPVERLLLLIDGKKRSRSVARLLLLLRLVVLLLWLLVETLEAVVLLLILLLLGLGETLETALGLRETLEGWLLGRRVVIETLEVVLSLGRAVGLLRGHHLLLGVTNVTPTEILILLISLFLLRLGFGTFKKFLPHWFACEARA